MSLSGEAKAFSDTVNGALIDDAFIVVIKNPPVNAIGASVRSGLLAALDAAEVDERVACIVLTGAGRFFVGGADIREFDAPTPEPTLPTIIRRIDSMSKPVVAAINGSALGGGLELALAAQGRIASPDANMGLPEVKLGLVPGAGGTQLLPRLVGLAAAAEMIASGRAISAADALSMGLIDEIATDDLLDRARRFASALGKGPLRRTGQLTPALGAGAASPSLEKILTRGRGQLAPVEAVRLVGLAAATPLEEGMREERATFLRLKEGEQSAALRYVFFAERAAAKFDTIGASPRPIRTMGIVGLGRMGVGIAAVAAQAGLQVAGVDRTPDAADRAREQILALLARAAAAQGEDEQRRAAWAGAMVTSDDIASVRDADFIIEATYDDEAVKIDALRAIEAVARPDAVIATNTSYLDTERLADVLAQPERFLGMHYFSPAHIMRLVEVVRCARTSPETLATAVELARKMRKLPIVCGVIEGFIGNRMFSAYREAAEFMVEDGASPYEIDAALEAFGLAMGPFAVSDLAGLEIAWARRKRAEATRDPAKRYPVVADRLCEAGRLGQRTRAGWYAYRDGRREPDPAVVSLIEQVRQESPRKPRSFGAQEIVESLLEAMRKEGAYLLDSNVAQRASDIDLVMINGYGFPAYRGGPMFIAERKLRP